MADGFPRAAGAVIFPEFAGNEIEVGFRLLPTAEKDAFEVRAVLDEFGQIGDGLAGGADEAELSEVGLSAEGVEGFFSLAAVGDEVGLAKECELRGDAGLGHAEDFLEFGDGQLFSEQQCEEADACGVGEDFKRVPRGVHRAADLQTETFLQEHRLG